MKSIGNNELISDITIPGTHDTMALHGGPFAECQNCPLKAQLESGIRYLDLRVRAEGNKLKLVHGVISQHIELPEVLNIVSDFLKSHESEAVLVRIKPERLFKNNKADVETHVENLLRNNPHIPTWFGQNTPSMGDVRGKIVFIKKKEFNLGLPIHGTDLHGDYKVRNIDDKINKIKTHLQEAGKACGKGEIILTYSSGTGVPVAKPLLTPEKIAGKINSWLHGYLKESLLQDSPDATCFGVIAMDFPDSDLLKTVIELNNMRSTRM